MKKAKKFLVYALCILLSVVIACSTLIAGAADNTSYAVASSKSAVPSALEEESTTAEKEIEDIIAGFVSENGWQDDISEVGDDILDFSKKAEIFLTNLIEKLEAAVERFTEFLKQIFRVGVFD